MLPWYMVRSCFFLPAPCSADGRPPGSAHPRDLALTLKAGKMKPVSRGPGAPGPAPLRRARNGRVIPAPRNVWPRYFLQENCSTHTRQTPYRLHTSVLSAAGADLPHASKTWPARSSPAQIAPNRQGEHTRHTTKEPPHPRTQD